ncbi:MAG TPA: hypothetical protein VMU37_07670 [Caulobacteraceae bacterium]|nr:hypothetical protein [Caulobacteraceae bacterium]
MRGLLALALLVASPALASPTPDPTGESPRAFVTRLYGRYAHGQPDYAGKDAPSVFTSRVIRLIDRDRARTPPGDVGALDGDPICDCQDDSGLKLVRLDVRASGPETATAAAHLRFAGGEQQTVRLDLVRTGHTTDMPSLVRLLSAPLK